MMMSLILISTNCQLMVPQVPIMGLVFSITITSLGEYQGLLIMVLAQSVRRGKLPVSWKYVSRRKCCVGGATLSVGLHIQQGEHAPVVEADDGPDPGPRPVPGRGLDVLHPRLVQGQSSLHQPVLLQSNSKMIRIIFLLFLYCGLWAKVSLIYYYIYMLHMYQLYV